MTIEKNWQKYKEHLKWVTPWKKESIVTGILLEQVAKAFGYAGLYKDGGRVKGVGKATHGYGKAMRKQGKK